MWPRANPGSLIAPRPWAMNPRFLDAATLGSRFLSEILERPGARVARVHEGLFAPGFSSLVDDPEGSQRDVDLAAHFEDSGCAFDRERDRPDRAHSVRDIVAPGPVTACQGAHERAVFVADRAGDAVDLGLAHKADRCVVTQDLDDACDPLIEFFLGICVVDREHGDLVLEGLEAVDRLASHA